MHKYSYLPNWIVNHIFQYVKINRVNSFYLIFGKLNGYIEEIDKNKYLTLVPTNQTKKRIKKYEELWSKIRNLIRSITKKSDVYAEKYMKNKFDSDHDLFLKKMIEIYNVKIVVRAIFMKITNIIRKFS